MLFVFCTMPYQSEDDTRARYIDPALKEAAQLLMKSKLAEVFEPAMAD